MITTRVKTVAVESPTLGSWLSKSQCEEQNMLTYTVLTGPDESFLLIKFVQAISHIRSMTAYS